MPKTTDTSGLNIHLQLDLEDEAVYVAPDERNLRLGRRRRTPSPSPDPAQAPAALRIPDVQQGDAPGHESPEGDDAEPPDDGDETGADGDEELPDAGLKNANPPQAAQRGALDQDAGYLPQGQHPVVDDRPPYLRWLDYSPGYEIPTAANRPTGPSPPARPLTELEVISLTNFLIYLRQGDTTRSFEEHADLLSLARGGKERLLSRYRCESLLQELSDFNIIGYDACPQGCQAYTGDLALATTCDSMRSQPKLDADGQPVRLPDGKIKEEAQRCGAERYIKSRTNSKTPKAPKPKHQAVFFPFVPRFRAMLGNPDYAKLLGYFRNRLESNIRLRQTESGLDFSKGNFHDVPDGKIAAGFADFFLSDDHTSAVMLSVDGARVDQNKPGELWAWTMQVYDLAPTEGRYRRRNVFDVLLSYGPSNPSNLESFNFIILSHIMDATMGFWAWDSLRRKTIVWRCGLLAVLADLQAQKKCSGLRLIAGRCGCPSCYQISVAPPSGAGRYLARGGATFYSLVRPGSDPVRRYNPDQPAAGYNPQTGGTPARERGTKEYFQ